MKAFRPTAALVLAAIACQRAGRDSRTSEAPPPPKGPVTFERIRNAEAEPGNWLTYSGQYHARRHSRLDQIHRGNVNGLEIKWAYQLRTLTQVETTPLAVDGILYVTRSPSDVIALDARTGQPFWTYEHKLPERISVCCGKQNRGVALLGDRLYLGTLDARLMALDSKTGFVIWDVQVADPKTGYSITSAPLIVKDKVITGIAGGEFGIRGFVDAYDAATGKRAWRFNTIPAKGGPGGETWEGDSWKTGGAPTWVTGAFDPELGLLYWGTGNPAPDWNGDAREGDNLYSDS